jgi:hypothetical protein
MFGGFTTSPLSDADARKLEGKSDTLYMLMRIIYKDHSGLWAFDACLGSQDPSKPGVEHQCGVHSNPRYRFHARTPLRND